eukprot:4569563-Pleurochrysis_carterae.AAC.1
MSSARSAAAASLGSRIPPAEGEGARLSTCAWGIRTGAYRRPLSSRAKGKATRAERFMRERTRPVQRIPPCSWQVYAGHSLRGMKTKSPGLVTQARRGEGAYATWAVPEGKRQRRRLRLAAGKRRPTLPLVRPQTAPALRQGQAATQHERAG